MRCRSLQLRSHQVLRYNGVSGQTVVKCSNTFVIDFAQRKQNSGGVSRRVHSYMYTEKFDDYRNFSQMLRWFTCTKDVEFNKIRIAKHLVPSRDRVKQDDGGFH